MELPGELRKLEQMRRERQEWAADHYPVTEQGLLARFSPRAQSPPQTSPETQGQSQTQADSFEPATVKSPSSTQVDPVLHNLPVSPQSVTDVSSFDVCASPDPAAQAPVPAAVSDLRKEMSVNIPPGPLGVGRGHTEVLMDTMGRGRPFWKEQSSVPALPAIGRGFLLQISQAQFPNPQCYPQKSTWDRETPGRMETAPSSPIHTLSQEVMPQPGPIAGVLPKDTSTLREEALH